MDLRGAAIAGSLAILGAIPIATPARAQNVQVAAGHWTVDYGNVRCSLARRLGGQQSPILILSSFLGRDEPEVVLMRDGSEVLPDLPSRVEVVLGPSEEVRRGTRRGRRVEGGRIVTLEGLGEGFIERFAESQVLRIRAGSRVLAELRTPNAGAAVAALKACNDDLLRSWGIDTEARRNWQRTPTVASGSINDGDYPPDALRQGQSGSVVVRFMVGTDGQASECRVVVTSHVSILDSETCRLISERLRYRPALDAQGQVVAATFIQTVHWRMPED